MSIQSVIPPMEFLTLMSVGGFLVTSMVLLRHLPTTLQPLLWTAVMLMEFQSPMATLDNISGPLLQEYLDKARHAPVVTPH